MDCFQDKGFSALQRTGDLGKLSEIRQHLELLASIDPSPKLVYLTPTQRECSKDENEDFRGGYVP